MSLFQTVPIPRKLRQLKETTNNPYWREVQQLPGNMSPWQERWEPCTHHLVNPDDYSSLRAVREQLVRKYAWSIPDPLTLAVVVEHAAPRVLEIGAGTGYWAWQLSQLGVDVLAYDSAPPDQCTDNYYHSPHSADTQFTNELRQVFYPVSKGGPPIAAEHPSRTLLLCWPPYSDDMAAKCLSYYAGKRLIYIGEGDGGCTGDDLFHQMLEKDWQEVETHTPVQWEYIHDRVYIYDRLG